LASASPFHRYWHPCSIGIALLGIGIPSLLALASLHPCYNTPRYRHPCSIGILSLSVLTSPLHQYQHPCSIVIALLSIGISSLLVLASLLPWYSIPRYWHPCSIGIPSPSVSVSPLSRYQNPCSLTIPLLGVGIPQTLLSLVSSIVSLSCISTPIYDSSSLSTSIGFV
jgi:hypothetical protein